MIAICIKCNESKKICAKGMCIKCYMQDYDKKKHLKAVLTGMCTSCKRRSPLPGKSTCQKCMERVKATISSCREHHNCVARKSYAKSVQLKRCTKCGEPAEGNKTMCSNCLAKRRSCPK